MEYIIGAVIVVICIFAGAYYLQKKADQKLENKIRNSFGNVPDLEYKQEKYESIGFYSREMAKRHPDDKDHFTVDNITWNDLDMDDVFLTACATQSAIGEEYLYYLLRTPALNNETLAKREKLIRFFEKDPETRVKIQLALAKAGKISGISVYEYVSRLDSLKEENNFKHFSCIVLMVAAISMIFVYPPIGIVGTLGVFFYNVISYFKRKSEIENYYQVVAYILRTLDLSQKLCSFKCEELKPYTEVLSEELKRYKNVTKGAALIVSKKSSGDILEVALDYLRMATHIDLIRFNIMLKRLKDKKDDFDKIYETIGLIDAMIAAASYRELMGDWCEPELFEKKDSISLGEKHRGINAENIYHPMIAEPVKNNFSEKGNVLLTGSNASGKSTFIKTVAINSILAQSIHTCMADSFKASFFKCMTSMALTDNLSGGESYYIVEIKSLKRICDSLNDDVPLLIFVDEVLRGTNTLERIAASSRILSYVGNKNCMLFAATHDIELTYILEKSFKLYHFEEKVEDDGVFFDYTLRDGRAVTRNAILLLKMMGFEESITDAAEKAADEFVTTGEWKPES
ncbi:MAG: hypothetical protein IK007_09465 [Lachnospiraceae bacterium]|nr:hypothetical protein [Lachnospiraceae bacterium]